MIWLQLQLYVGWPPGHQATIRKDDKEIKGLEMGLSREMTSVGNLRTRGERELSRYGNVGYTEMQIIPTNICGNLDKNHLWSNGFCPFNIRFATKLPKTQN